MYIHLGNDYMVSLAEIIAIVNVEPPISSSVKDIIELAIAEKNIYQICDKGKEKSLILTERHLYLSPISSATLFKRASKFKEV